MAKTLRDLPRTRTALVTDPNVSLDDLGYVDEDGKPRLTAYGARVLNEQTLRLDQAGSEENS